MKISGSFLTMLIIALLGFTHFLGGPYVFFQVIFWIMLLPFFFGIIFLFFLLLKTKKILRKNININTEHTYSSNQETLHVEAVIQED